MKIYMEIDTKVDTKVDTKMDIDTNLNILGIDSSFVFVIGIAVILFSSPAVVIMDIVVVCEH